VLRLTTEAEEMHKSIIDRTMAKHPDKKIPREKDENMRRTAHREYQRCHTAANTLVKEALTLHLEVKEVSREMAVQTIEEILYAAPLGEEVVEVQMPTDAEKLDEVIRGIEDPALETMPWLDILQQVELAAVAMISASLIRLPRTVC
jgi:hypothetical protein